jgi:hypothetical protein
MYSMFLTFDPEERANVVVLQEVDLMAQPVEVLCQLHSPLVYDLICILPQFLARKLWQVFVVSVVLTDLNIDNRDRISSR